MSYEVEIYKLDIANNQFVYQDKISGFYGLSYFNEENAVGDCEFFLEARAPQATRSNLQRFVNHVAIKRNGVCDWFGPIVDVRAEIQSQGAAIRADLTIRAQTMLSHFFSRHTQYDSLREYQNEERADGIAWDLINYTQGLTNGSLGIIKGTIPTTPVYSESYEAFSNIGDAILDLSAGINGFDFNFNPTLTSGRINQVQFSVSYPRKNTEPNIPPFRIGGRYSNVYGASLRTKQDITNYGVGVGAGTGDEVTRIEQSFGASQAGFTRREKLYPYKAAALASTVQTLLSAEMTNDSAESFEVQINLKSARPRYGDFGIGDTVTVIMEVGNENGILNFSRKGRIKAVSVSVDNNGSESITPTIQLFN